MEHNRVRKKTMRKQCIWWNVTITLARYGFLDSTKTLWQYKQKPAFRQGQVSCNPSRLLWMRWGSAKIPKGNLWKHWETKVCDRRAQGSLRPPWRYISNHTKSCGFLYFPQEYDTIPHPMIKRLRWWSNEHVLIKFNLMIKYQNNQNMIIKSSIWWSNR